MSDSKNDGGLGGLRKRNIAGNAGTLNTEVSKSTCTSSKQRDSGELQSPDGIMVPKDLIGKAPLAKFETTEGNLTFDISAITEEIVPLRPQHNCVKETQDEIEVCPDSDSDESSQKYRKVPSCDGYDSDIDHISEECDVDMITFPRQAVKAGRRAAGEAAKRAAEAAGRAKERASEAAGRVSEAAGRVSECAHEAAERVSERAHEVAERAGRMKDKAAEAAACTAENAKRYGRKVKEAFVWKVTHFNLLPSWLKDNEFLHDYHRPQLPSFKVCFKSMFRIHTETGNIWTHLLGSLAFLSLMIYYLVTSVSADIKWQEITVYVAFFISAIICMGFSWVFHTCYCHSREAAKLFSKLDYSGITVLIVGSFVPWLYFGFYCDNLERCLYIGLIVILGLISAVVALRDKFSTPSYRPIRAGVFITLGLSAIIPAIHFVVLNGFAQALEGGSLQWMVLMGSLYIGGAVLYAVRIPERLFPGKCDIWFQSHQIFHIMVIAAAFVHYHGLNLMAEYRERVGECDSMLDTETETLFVTTMTQTLI